MFELRFHLEQCPGSVVGQDPSVPKTPRLHVDIFRPFFIEPKNISKFLQMDR